MHQHLSAFMGFSYWMRKDDPVRTGNYDEEYDYQRPEAYGLNAFNTIEEKVAIAIREVNRCTFYYCRYSGPEAGANTDVAPKLPCSVGDTIAALEAELIDTLMEMAETSEQLVCDNNRREPNSHLLCINRPAIEEWLRSKI